MESAGLQSVIVNCDSRQIYRNLNIGTGKVSGDWQSYGSESKAYFVRGIPHFLIDYVDPTTRYSMTDYLTDWCDLYKYDLPENLDYVILVGGTGLWAKAIMEEFQPGIIKTEFQASFDCLRDEIETYSLQQLQKESSRQDFNNSDWNNPRRLSNALLRGVAKTNSWTTQLDYPVFGYKQSYAIDIDQNRLQSNIQSRLDSRIEEGLIQEVEALLYLKDRLLELGLEYRLTYLYLLGQMSKETWEQSLVQENIRYAKRQRTWLKKQDVCWIHSIEDITTIL